MFTLWHKLKHKHEHNHKHKEVHRCYISIREVTHASAVFPVLMLMFMLLPVLHSCKCDISIRIINWTQFLFLMLMLCHSVNQALDSGDTWCCSINFLIVRLILFKSHLVGLSFIRVSNSRSPNSACWVFTRAKITFDESSRSLFCWLRTPAGLVGSAPTVTVCKSASSSLTSKLVDSKLRALIIV